MNHTWTIHGLYQSFLYSSCTVHVQFTLRHILFLKRFLLFFKTLSYALMFWKICSLHMQYIIFNIMRCVTTIVRCNDNTDYITTKSWQWFLLRVVSYHTRSQGPTRRRWWRRWRSNSNSNSNSIFKLNKTKYNRKSKTRIVCGVPTSIKSDLYIGKCQK